MNLKNLILLGILMVVFSGLTTLTAQSQWRGPNRDGIYSETNLLKQWPAEGPEMLWSFEDLGTGQGSK